jgi:hypothetical protein
MICVKPANFLIYLAKSQLICEVHIGGGGGHKALDAKPVYQPRTRSYDVVLTMQLKMKISETTA